MWFGQIDTRCIEEGVGEHIELLPKVSYRQDDNEFFQFYRQGDSGYGDPLEHDPEGVPEDDLNELLSLRKCRSEHPRHDVKAERVGFEPTRRLNTAYAISNRAPSANSDTSPETLPWQFTRETQPFGARTGDALCRRG